MTTNIYSYQEVSTHNNENDCWMIMHGGVYDLTKFLTEHPGGEEILLKSAGLDGSDCFDDIGHTREASQLREKYKVGIIDVNSSPVNKPNDNNNDNNDDDWEIEEQEEVKNNQKYLLPIVIGIGAFVYFIILYSFNLI
ncbi:cytochrome b5-like [Aphidius gifuensis]|uniref:cytochrome b5-like n=1 Tax=Aphidius gifuensis TaxID=684658 RepID=UPI001CDD6916|nr:cytochrome b5-like [Aphidius gifuensis]